MVVQKQGSKDLIVIQWPFYMISKKMASDKGKEIALEKFTSIWCQNASICSNAYLLSPEKQSVSFCKTMFSPLL
jgi:hypothetical protein